MIDSRFLLCPHRIDGDSLAPSRAVSLAAWAVEPGSGPR
jgi:hypothetical protein